MGEATATTWFAPAGRAAPPRLAEQGARLAADPTIRAILEGFPEPAMIVNAERQIVLANEKLARFADASLDEIFGKRPGEALACVNRAAGPDGCGTSRFCRYCGAARALVQCIESNRTRVEECRLTRQVPQGLEAFELVVWGTPVEVGGETFTVFALRDASDAKRRDALERIFFHDVLNTAGGLQGLASLLPDASPEVRERIEVHLYDLAEQLVEEIQAQRDLAAAERDELEVRWRGVDVGALLERLRVTYEHHACAAGKRVEIELGDVSARIETDEALLRRVLGNLLKNALEASRPGARVSLRYSGDPIPTFEVHNEDAMPEEARLQVFQRSFSTKSGRGRGLGTYSVKLLAERYLGGAVSFRSDEGIGTTFAVALPRRTPPRPP